MEIKDKTVVSLHYKGTLEDGSVFDSSEGKDPLVFLCGSGMIIPGLEEGIKGLKKGDKKEVKISSDQAYGPVRDDARQEMPKEQMPEGVEIKEGMQLAAQGPQGSVPVVVAEVKDDSVIIDFNHPLAGKDLTFDVEIVEVREPTEEEIEHGHAHGPGGHQH